VTSLGVQALRRIVGAVARFGATGARRHRASDVRQLKVELESGLILVVTASATGRAAPAGVGRSGLAGGIPTKQQIEKCGSTEAGP